MVSKSVDILDASQLLAGAAGPPAPAPPKGAIPAPAVPSPVRAYGLQGPGPGNFHDLFGSFPAGCCDDDLDDFDFVDYLEASPPRAFNKDMGVVQHVPTHQLEGDFGVSRRP